MIITAGSKNFTQFLINDGTGLSDRISDFTFDRREWGGRFPFWFDFNNDGLLDVGIVVQGDKIDFARTGRRRLRAAQFGLRTSMHQRRLLHAVRPDNGRVSGLGLRECERVARTHLRHVGGHALPGSHQRVERLGLEHHRYRNSRLRRRPAHGYFRIARKVTRQRRRNRRFEFDRGPSHEYRRLGIGPHLQNVRLPVDRAALERAECEQRVHRRRWPASTVRDAGPADPHQPVTVGLDGRWYGAARSRHGPRCVHRLPARDTDLVVLQLRRRGWRRQLQLHLLVPRQHRPDEQPPALRHQRERSAAGTGAAHEQRHPLHEPDRRHGP